MDLVEIKKGLPSALRAGAPGLKAGPKMSMGQKLYIQNRRNANELGNRAGVRIGNARTIEGAAKKLRKAPAPYSNIAGGGGSELRAAASRQREFAGEDMKLGRRSRDASKDGLWRHRAEDPKQSFFSLPNLP